MQARREIENTIRQALQDAQGFINSPESIRASVENSIEALAKFKQQLKEVKQLQQMISSKAKELQIKLNAQEKKEHELQERVKAQLTEIEQLSQKKSKLELKLQELELSYALDRLAAEEESLNAMVEAQEQIIVELQELDRKVASDDKALWDSIPAIVANTEQLRDAARQDIAALQNKNAESAALIGRLWTHSHPYTLSGHSAYSTNVSGVPRPPRPK